MTINSTIELRDLHLATRIGTYGLGDVVPEEHLLDLTFTVPADLVLIGRDDLALVFDYDPLIAQIDLLAREGNYTTQEWLVSRIASAVAAHPEIVGVEICLRKTPVLNGTGSLGVRLTLSAAALAGLRSALLLAQRERTGAVLREAPHGD